MLARQIAGLMFALWCIAGLGAEAQVPAEPTPAQIAVAYYQICGQVPLNLAAINALRSKRALEADRKLSPADLQARAGVLTAVGGHGSLLAVRVVALQVTGERASVSVLLNYRVLAPRRLEISLVKEPEGWRVAD